MEQFLTIGKLAKAADVGVETVRYYQRRGLLETPQDVGSVRRYSDEHVQRLRFIKRAQSVGFTLEEIAELLSLNDSQDHQTARQLASEKVADIEMRIDRLNTIANALRQLVRQCECGGKELPCPIIRMAVD
ncbi:MerR family transcriptional regulator [Propionivibrio limicola]|uniref:MerR family transcriptional regulator n=1 Tax=Propionivibrio limicola TaxID=167645 RepID=UPI00129135DF|nr:MerR family transcriptional regulator [Propionivibrio limicola]